MKIRFYPKKETIRSILQESMNDTEKLINETNTKLAKLQASALYTADDSAERYAEIITHNQGVLERSRARLEAFDSHSPSEIMAEIEL